MLLSVCGIRQTSKPSSLTPLMVKLTPSIAMRRAAGVDDVTAPVVAGDHARFEAELYVVGGGEGEVAAQETFSSVTFS